MLVSAIIPTRDRRQLMARALSSVLQQADVELEAVIVDEASTDGTRERVAEFGDDRITYLRNDRPTGVARARNRGIAEARGDWIAFLDDDDIWAPTKLRSQLDACAAAGADFSYTGLVTTDVDLATRKPSLPPSPRGLALDLLGMNVIGPPSSVMAHRSLLQRAGDFDPGYSVLADWDMWLRLEADGRPAACDEPLTAYITHPSNMHLDVDRTLAEFRRLRAKHAGLASSAGRKLGDDRWWGWIATSLRRSGHRFRGAALFGWLGLRFGRPRLVARAAGMLAGERASDLVRAMVPAQDLADRRPAPAARWLDAFVDDSVPSAAGGAPSNTFPAR